MDEHSGTGPDQIAARVLRQCRDALEVPVLLLARVIFNQGRWPSIWRTHWVHPIYKKKSRANVRNYRGGAPNTADLEGHRTCCGLRFFTLGEPCAIIWRKPVRLLDATKPSGCFGRQYLQLVTFSRRRVRNRSLLFRCVWCFRPCTMRTFFLLFLQSKQPRTPETCLSLGTHTHTHTRHTHARTKHHNETNETKRTNDTHKPRRLPQRTFAPASFFFVYSSIEHNAPP